MVKQASSDGDLPPDDIDIQIGVRIRECRGKLRMSQEKLGEALKLTFQQIQKYERGINRVSASRLYQLCQIFNVSPFYFYEGLPGFEAKLMSSYEVAEEQDDLRIERRALTPDQAELLANFSRIADPRSRALVLELSRTLSGAKTSDEE